MGHREQQAAASDGQNSGGLSWTLQDAERAVDRGYQQQTKQDFFIDACAEERDYPGPRRARDRKVPQFRQGAAKLSVDLAESNQTARECNALGQHPDKCVHADRPGFRGGEMPHEQHGDHQNRQQQRMRQSAQGQPVAHPVVGSVSQCCGIAGSEQADSGFVGQHQWHQEYEPRERTSRAEPVITCQWLGGRSRQERCRHETWEFRSSETCRSRGDAGFMLSIGRRRPLW